MVQDNDDPDDYWTQRREHHNLGREEYVERGRPKWEDPDRETDRWWADYENPDFPKPSEDREAYDALWWEESAKYPGSRGYRPPGGSRTLNPSRLSSVYRLVNREEFRLDARRDPLPVSVTLFLRDDTGPSRTFGSRVKRFFRHAERDYKEHEWDQYLGVPGRGPHHTVDFRDHYNEALGRDRGGRASRVAIDFRTYTRRGDLPVEGWFMEHENGSPFGRMTFPAHDSEAEDYAAEVEGEDFLSFSHISAPDHFPSGVQRVHVDMTGLDSSNDFRLASVAMFRIAEHAFDGLSR